MKAISWMKQGSLAEAVSTRIEMCLVDANNEGITVPVRCKDFLSDAYYAEALGVDTSIWGFKHKHGTIKDWSSEPLRLAMRLKDEPLTEDHATNLEALLNAFEDVLGPSKVLADGKGSLAIIAAKGWAQSPWRISLMTMLMRQGLVYDAAEETPLAFLKRIAKDDNPLCPGDAEWVKGTLKPMEELMKGSIPLKLAKKDSYTAFESTHECHHGGGIYAVYTGTHTG